MSFLTENASIGKLILVSTLLFAGPALAQENVTVPEVVPLPLQMHQESDKDAEAFNVQVFKRAGIVLVEFMRPTCLACDPTARLLDQLTSEYGEKVRWLRLNMDTNLGLSYKYDVPKVPAILVFKDGRLVKKFVGFKESEKTRLSELIDSELRL